MTQHEAATAIRSTDDPNKANRQRQATAPDRMWGTSRTSTRSEMCDQDPVFRDSCDPEFEDT